MILIIDASNIKSGGGLTHLIEILKFDFPVEMGFESVVVFAPAKTLEKLPQKLWLFKMGHKWLNSGYFNLLIWKIFIFNKYIKRNRGLVFIPGTGFCIKPFVTMCRNLLPMELREINRFFLSKEWIRLFMLRFVHLMSYKRAYGIIFLNSYCRQVIENQLKLRDGNRNIIIGHGLNKSVFINEYNIQKKQRIPFNLIYVSTVNLYKHQWLIVDAIDDLNQSGYSIRITFVGNSEPSAYKKLLSSIKKAKNPDYFNYVGAIEYEKLRYYYNDSDAFIFGSTCETFGMVILEAMACGLPVLCSNCSSMPTTFQNIPIYFDINNPQSIKDAIIKIYNNDEICQNMSMESRNFSEKFSWEDTSRNTFTYLSNISKSIYK